MAELPWIRLKSLLRLNQNVNHCCRYATPKVSQTFIVNNTNNYIDWRQYAKTYKVRQNTYIFSYIDKNKSFNALIYMYMWFIACLYHTNVCIKSYLISYLFYL